MKRKPVPVAVQPNPLRTIADLRRWMQEHVRGGDDNGKPWTRKSLDAAVLWFHCMQEAETILDDMRAKDYAHLLLHGMPATTLADVQVELDELYAEHEEFTSDDPITPAHFIEEQLRGHFGKFAT